MAIGLYGKLPSQGDFVSRRLPWEVTAAWDDWLQSGISQARASIAADWNDCYLNAPLWRLQLAPGVLGSGAWIGFWFASVDRVGRQFPLVLLEPLPASSIGRYALIEQDDTFLQIEEVALQALDPRLGFDVFDRSLDGLSLLQGNAATAPPISVAVGVESLAGGVGAGGGVGVGSKGIRIDADADAAAALQAAEAAGPPGSCFFSWGNERHSPCLLRCDGLPEAGRFRHFLDGRWD